VAADSATTTPGSVVGYAITVTDTGQTPYAPATVTADLANVLNDAAYNGDAAATSGAVAYAGHILTWTGDLAPGDTAAITYSITIDNPDNGDKHLVTTAVSTDPGSTCPPGGANPACTATVTDLIPALTIIKTASAASAAPGTAVDYAITVDDTGQTPYAGATVTDDLAGVVGAAAYDGDAAATIGAVSHAGPALGHHQQPRDRRREPGQHRHLGRARQHLPAGNQQPPVHRDHRRHHRPADHDRPRHRGPGLRDARDHHHLQPGNRGRDRRPRLRRRLGRHRVLEQFHYRSRRPGRDHPGRQRAL
jgi:hypothetical protein